MNSTNDSLFKLQKKLTPAQLEAFKQLYNADYSASLIFEKLGQPYPIGESHRANQRMRAIRIKLGLPKRKTGHRPKHGKYKIPRSEIEMRNKRIRKLKQIIPRWTLRLEAWKRELEELEKKNRVC